jgi:hypothetical protein
LQLKFLEQLWLFQRRLGRNCGQPAQSRLQLSADQYSEGIQHIRVEGSVEQGPTVVAAFRVIGKGSLEATVVNLKEEAE